MAEEQSQDKEKFRKITADIDIPPHPKILTSFLEESNKAEPDLKAIGNLLATDVAIAAGILKTINSPFFGLRQNVASIQQAVMLLGLTNVSNLVYSMALKKAMGGGSTAFLEQFWNRCNTIALLSARIGKMVSHVAPDEIYALALMCDCAVPLLSKRYDEYEKFYQTSKDDNQNHMPIGEEDQFMITHPGFGSHIGETWKFPSSICEGIAHHHDVNLEELYEFGDLITLVAIYNFAVAVYNKYKKREAHFEWLKLKAQFMVVLKITENDVLDMEDVLIDLLIQD